MTTTPTLSSPVLPHPSGLLCPPRWGTPRTLSRPTLGPAVAEVARLLGHELMPWQQYVADVALELDPVTGLPVYREVGVTVPRQQGKTLMILVLMVHRALGFGLRRRQNVIYTAQTRNDARKKLEDDHLPILDVSKLRSRYRTRMTNGSEAILWKNRSKIGITSATEKAGHGETLDLGIIDEAFAHVDDRLEQAMKPAMLTRDDAQLWWMSTAGKRTSTYLLGKVEVGRQIVEAGVTEGVAFFEWSADPNSDPADPQTWRSCMPALGYTITESAVAADQKSMKPAEFRRACLNIADTESVAGWQVIGETAWATAADAASAPEDPVCFAIDVSRGDAHAAIAVAGWQVGGHREAPCREHAPTVDDDCRDCRRYRLRHVELVAHERGTGWVVPWILERVQKWNPCAVVIDQGGPANVIVPALERAWDDLIFPDLAARCPLVKPTVREVGQASGQFYDGICSRVLADRSIRHVPHPGLTSAVAGAMKRPLGEAWAWGRQHSSVDISPVVAASLALWGHAGNVDRPVEGPTQLVGSLMA